MQNPYRFIFSANAVAVADNAEPPGQTGKAWASVALPMTGGTVTTDHLSHSDAVLSFSDAWAEIKGWHDSASDTYITENRVVVKGLDIEKPPGAAEGWLHADQIEVMLTFKFKKSTPNLTVEVNPDQGPGVPRRPYTGLKIAGQSFSNVVLEKTKPKDAGQNHKNFRAAEGPDNKEHHIHKSGTNRDLRFHTSIARDIDPPNPPPNRLKFDNPDYGRIRVHEDKTVSPFVWRVFTGTDAQFLALTDRKRCVYLGEWAQDEDWQGIVGLRVAFLDGDGNITRQIVVADWLGDNGQFYP